MKTIEKEIQYEIKIQKSRFITLLYPLHHIDMVSAYLSQAKETFPNATHYCFAYILDNIERFSDDGEPSGTAGMPMLNVLKNQDLNHILVIIVRYFGGIKLGTGGLVRAYTNSVSKALETTTISFFELGYCITIQFSYERIKEIDYLCHPFSIKTKNYQNEVIYVIEIFKENYESFKRDLNRLHIPILKTEMSYIKKCD